MPAVRFHLRNSQQAVKGSLLVTFAIFIEAASVMDSARASLIPPTLIASGILALAYVFYFRPYVLLDDEGITLQNWIRTVRIPWEEYSGHVSKLGLEILSGQGSDAVACYPRSIKRSDRWNRKTDSSRGGFGPSRQAYRPEPALRPKASLQWATPLQARLAIDSAHKEAAKQGKAADFFTTGKDKGNSTCTVNGTGADECGNSSNDISYSRRLSPVSACILTAGIALLAEGIRQALNP